MESEPHNLETFVCLVDEKADKQVWVSEQERAKPKNQADELVKVYLTNKDEVPQPIFLSANLSSELGHTILTLLREFWDVFLDLCRNAKPRLAANHPQT